VAVVAFFWRDWARLIPAFLKNLRSGPSGLLSESDSRLLILIFLGSIPAALVGLLFREQIETSVRSLLLVGVNMIAFGLLLYWVDRSFSKERKIEKVGVLDAVLVGVAQAISLLPGVSRSGITITAARSQKLDREAAARFSFLLSTPAIVGAGLLTFQDMLDLGFDGNQAVFIVGFLSSMVSGWLAIKFLLTYISSHNFNIFVIYRLAFGAFLIGWALFIN
jgi:undecaprenyl-diphosphatase